METHVALQRYNIYYECIYVADTRKTYNANTALAMWMLAVASALSHSPCWCSGAETGCPATVTLSAPCRKSSGSEHIRLSFATVGRKVMRVCPSSKASPYCNEVEHRLQSLGSTSLPLYFSTAVEVMLRLWYSGARRRARSLAVDDVYLVYFSGAWSYIMKRNHWM